MKKITKFKIVNGNIWYYLADVDEIDEEGYPLLSAFETNALVQGFRIMFQEMASTIAGGE